VESGKGQGPLVGSGRLHTCILQGPTEFLATPPLMGPVCLLNQGRFEEPVRPCVAVFNNSRHICATRFREVEVIVINYCYPAVILTVDIF